MVKCKTKLIPCIRQGLEVRIPRGASPEGYRLQFRSVTGAVDTAVMRRDRVWLYRRTKKYDTYRYRELLTDLVASVMVEETEDG